MEIPVGKRHTFVLAIPIDDVLEAITKKIDVERVHMNQLEPYFFILGEMKKDGTESIWLNADDMRVFGLMRLVKYGGIR